MSGLIELCFVRGCFAPPHSPFPFIALEFRVHPAVRHWHMDRNTARKERHKQGSTEKGLSTKGVVCHLLTHKYLFVPLFPVGMRTNNTTDRGLVTGGGVFCCLCVRGNGTKVDEQTIPIQTHRTLHTTTNDTTNSEYLAPQPLAAVVEKVSLKALVTHTACVDKSIQGR